MFARAGNLLFSPRLSLFMLGMMLIVPFLLPHHRQPIPSFFSEWLAVFFGSLALLPLLKRDNWQPMQFPVIALVPLGLLAVLLVQLMMGTVAYWQQHLLVAMYLLWALMLMLLGSNLRHQLSLEQVAPVLAWALLISGVLSALIVGLQWLGIEAGGWVFPRRGGAFVANTGQANHLANLTGLALGSLLYLHALGRLGKLNTAWIALLLLAALALTGARAGWLYMLLLLLLAGFFYFKTKAESTRYLLWGSALLLAAFAVLQYFLPFIHELASASGIFSSGNLPMLPGERLIVAAQGESIRLQFIEVAWRIFQTHPLLGVGFGQYPWHDLLLADEITHAAGTATHSHNLLMQVLAEAGLVGFIILFAGLAYWLWAGRREAMTLSRWWLLALLGVLFAHSMLEYPFWYTYFLGPAALLLGLGESRALQLRLSLGGLLSLALLLFAGFCLATLGKHEIKLERWANHKQLHKLSAEEFDAFATDMSTIRKNSPLAPFADTMLLLSLPMDKRDLKDKIAATERLLQARPYVGTAYRYATLLALDGRQDEALAHLERVMNRHPHQADRYWQEIVQLALRGSLEVYPLVQAIQARWPEDGEVQQPAAQTNPADTEVKNAADK